MRLSPHTQSSFRVRARSRRLLPRGCAFRCFSCHTAPPSSNISTHADLPCLAMPRRNSRSSAALHATRWPPLCLPVRCEVLLLESDDLLCLLCAVLATVREVLLVVVAPVVMALVAAALAAAALAAAELLAAVSADSCIAATFSGIARAAWMKTDGKVTVGAGAGGGGGGGAGVRCSDARAPCCQR